MHGMYVCVCITRAALAVAYVTPALAVQLARAGCDQIDALGSLLLEPTHLQGAAHSALNAISAP